MTREDEKYCLEEMAKGNRQAFEWLFLTWYPKLLDFFVRFLGNWGGQDLAYDLAQDVFMDVWTSRKKFSRVNSFSAYIFQMARFKLYNHFDKSAVKSRFREELLAKGAFAAPSVEPIMYAMEPEKLIWDEVKTMPPKRRRVFIMSRFLGYSNEQIAEEMDIDKRTVENHLTTALSALRKVVK